MRAAQVLEELHDILEGLVFEAEDPVDRAKRRMRDAYKRGGAHELIHRTRTRVKATKDQGKLKGIVIAINQVIDDEEFDLSPAQEKELHLLVRGVRAKGA